LYSEEIHVLYNTKYCLRDEIKMVMMDWTYSLDRGQEMHTEFW